MTYFFNDIFNDIIIEANLMLFCPQIDLEQHEKKGPVMTLAIPLLNALESSAGWPGRLKFKAIQSSY